ncbi:MAG: SURF1 family protein [Actinomycetota bacterium]
MRIRARQVALVAIAALIAIVCVRLGFWQLDRLHGRRQINAMLAERGALPGVSLESAGAAGLAYAHVRATGTYDPAHEIVLSGRSFQDTAGNHILTPLVLADGSAVLVDRGWVPLNVVAPPVSGEAAAPTGTVTVTGLALPPDAISASPSTPAPSVVVRIDLGVAGLPYDIAPVYVLLEAQDPAQSSGVPVPAAPPTLDEGPHLSYALQWFAFATIAVVGCIVLLRRDHERVGE